MKYFKLDEAVGIIFLLSLTLSVSTSGTLVSKQSGNSSSWNPLEDDDVFIPYQGERFSIFDWNFYKLMARRYGGNILVSPISLKIALVLLYEGAQDQTAYELAGVLHLPVGRWASRDQFSLILRSLQPVFNEYQLNLGTRIFMDTNIATKQSYAAVLKTFYSTDVVSLNFSNTNEVTETINSWVNNITDGNIPAMITNDNSVKNSVMLVMNALFFKGLWLKNRFIVNETKIDKFYESAEKSIDVSFINAAGSFYYAESAELDAKILRIPYVGRKFAMYLILPRTLEGLDHVIMNINPYVLTRHVWLMQKLPVDVKIPKFKFDFTTYLEPILREMGIKDIFENTATLTGIAKTKRSSAKLKVSEIIQKAGVEVNEEGTSAFAATEVNIGNKVADQEFIANHPFVFYIEDETTGTILYIGRINNPLERTGSTEMSSIHLPTRMDEKPVKHSQSLAAFPIGTSNFERYNYFNVELLQAVSESSSGNIVISPLSVRSALTILSEGAGGKTREELLSTLRLPADAVQIRAISRYALLPIQESKTGSEITMANRLWIDQRISIASDYNNLLQTYYGGDTCKIDFSNASGSSRTINEWVRQATKNNIDSIVDAGTLSEGMQLLLISATYFKGQWMKAFDVSATKNRCFHVPTVGCQTIPMMETVSKYHFAQIPTLDSQVVEIPYADGRFSMLIILPNREGLQSLQTLSRDVSYTPISVILSRLRETEILLQLPKFSIESKIDLRAAFEFLGIRDLFNANANLSGILPNGSFRVGSAIHSAKIEVNEVGTVAAAVTGISVVPLMGSTLEAFRVDRPFLFVLVDRPSATIIFAGRVVQPAAA